MKPEPGPVVAVALLLVAFVVTAVVFLVRKPGFVAPARPGRAAVAASSAVLKPPPSVVPVAVSPGNPASYLELLNADPERLPPEQARIANALNHAVSGISQGPDNYVALGRRVDQDIVQPLNTAKTQVDLDNLRTAGQRLCDEGKQARDFYTTFATTLTGKLAEAGLAAEVAGQVAAKFVERTQSTREPVFSGVETVGRDAIACVDVLVRNQKRWHRNASGTLAFRAKAVRTAYQTSSNQLRRDVDKLDQAIAQYR
ncbi:MAG TPA: hypothetical protein VGD78_04430 [Chthoniobacterales bacterium]